MPRHHRSTHSLLVLLALLLGLAMATPAGIAAQDDDDDDEGTPAGISAPGEDDTEATPGCDDDWRIVTTEDGDGFTSEDHCHDHVAEHGADSIVTLGAGNEEEYIALTLVPESGGCRAMLTLVNGRPDQVISVTIDTVRGQRLLSQFTPATGDVSDIGVISPEDQLKGGSANVLTLDFEPTGEHINIYPNVWSC